MARIGAQLRTHKTGARVIILAVAVIWLLGPMVPATSAVTTTGLVWTWGENLSGETGTCCTNLSVPHQTTSPTSVSAVGTGNNYSMAIRSDGTVWSWGDNSDGQFGSGSSNTGTDSTSPQQVLGPGGTGHFTSARQVAGGEDHSVILRSDGTVWTMGYAFDGELGNGTAPYNSPFPVQVKAGSGTGNLTGITAVSAGYKFAVARRSGGTVWAWGDNTYGQLGNKSASFMSNRPVEVQSPSGTGFLTSIVGIAAGQNHVLGVRSDGTVWGWGDDTYGQLGNNTNSTQSTLPVEVKGVGGSGALTGIVAVAGGLSHSAALRSDGTVWTWGEGVSGELGNGGSAESDTPVQVKGPGGVGSLSNIVAIAAGQWYTLALRSDGTVWAWGHNGFGQLGDGGSEFISRVPVQVHNISGMTGISTNKTHVLALRKQPVLSVSPLSAAPGASLAVTGWGYMPREQVPLVWNCSSVTSPSATVLATATADPTGAFTQTVKVPTDVFGQHNVGGKGSSSGVFALVAVGVVPSLTVTPASGARGSAATINGSGYSSGETVSIKWNCALKTCTGSTPLSSAKASTTGTLSAGIKIPGTATVGTTYAISAVGAASGGFSVTHYKVTS